MRRLLLALAFIAVAISGCMEKAPSSEEIMTKMDNSMANLSAYNYEISYEQTTSIKDLAKDNVTGEHNTTSFSLKGEEKTSINMTAHKRKADISTRTSQSGPTSSPKIMASNTTEYNMGNVTYKTTNNGTWIQQRDLRPEDVVWAEGGYDLIRSNTEFISQTFNQTQITVIGSENVGGKDCYKLGLIMDNRTHSGNAYGMLINSIPSPIPLVPEFNETELLKNSKIESMIWVEKGTYLPKKYQIIQSMRISPNIVGVLGLNGMVQMLNQSLRLGEISTEIMRTETYSDHNKPIEIIPPEEALNTTPIIPK